MINQVWEMGPGKKNSPVFKTKSVSLCGSEWDKGVIWSIIKSILDYFKNVFWDLRVVLYNCP